MKRSKSLSPEPSSSEAKRVKLEVTDLNGATSPNILEFSDDVLLYILKYLDPQDLMTLSLCCQRFARLTQDRTLWRNVDFRTQPMVLDDFDKYTKFLQPMTTSLAIRGDLVSNNTVLTQSFLKNVRTLCKQLKELIIEDYHINGDKIPITDFPSTIEKLSLEGCEMDYAQQNKSYFFKMDLHMPNLRCLILNFCDWFTPHSLLVISKIPKLTELRLYSCSRMGECVAYASLATRFGFKTLEILDLRNTGIGDSEVGCFSSTKSLQHLYLECPEHLREESPEIIQRQQQQRQRQANALQMPAIFEDDHLAQFLVEDEFVFERNYSMRCLVSDRAICALGSDLCDRRVINSSPEGMIIAQEEKQVSNNPNLKTLVVRHYPRVTNSSLTHLAFNVSTLEYLDVTGTSVTSEGIEAFKSERPSVKIVSSFMT
ncbi:uncharacterized protein LOC109851642 isoform X2 [Pseudomyrmex gracilis]|nr:uncharacterized protein LOC109851642 isoform X2 [Pseudomyrmex gracilis]XP_020277497.1 uncharacterized protein LOC109851642 isoform X2 [Pseudomyrmex gracilis]